MFQNKINFIFSTVDYNIYDTNKKTKYNNISFKN